MPVFSMTLDEALDELSDLKGKSVSELDIFDKAKIMTKVLDRKFHNTELAHKLVKIQNPDHDCTKRTCNSNCHRLLKARCFDLLYAQEVLS